jgi:hypothetical protein
VQKGTVVFDDSNAICREWRLRVHVESTAAAPRAPITASALDRTPMRDARPVALGGSVLAPFVRIAMKSKSAPP